MKQRETQCCTPNGQIKRYKDCIGCDKKPLELNQNKKVNVEKMKASEDYDGLKVQFNALKAIVASQQSQIQVYQKRIKELNVDRIIQLEAELESEKAMNAILTEELNFKSE